MSQTVICGIDVASADIIIPGGEGERLGNRVMIEAVKKAHEVPGYELARFGMLTDYIDLILLVRRPDIGDEVFPVEHQSGIVLADGNRDFRPVVVSLAPVGGGPVRIQVV